LAPVAAPSICAVPVDEPVFSSWSPVAYPLIARLPEAAPELRIEAYKWLQLASAQGYRSSQAAWGFVALGMTHEDVVDATRRIAAFVPVRANQPPAA